MMDHVKPPNVPAEVHSSYLLKQIIMYTAQRISLIYLLAIYKCYIPADVYMM